MRDTGLIRSIGKIVLGSYLMVALTLNASAAEQDYSLEDLKLPTAQALLDICAIEQSHEHYEVARAFCFGFFEGAVRYHEAIARSDRYKKIVCDPPNVTRAQGVNVYIEYMKANPQYGKEAPVDAIFRALMDEWPCDE